MTTERSLPMGWAVFLACWAISAAVALALGRDVNPDLSNYHYYNPYALLNGRWDLDLAPAGPHTFLHPGLDLPFYLLTRSPLNGWPRVVAALQAGHLGLLAFLTLALCNLACHGEAWRVTAASALVAAFGLTGAATLPEAGATQNDIPIACLAIGALLALLLAAREDEVRPGRATALRLLAGFAGGAAVAFKLTAVVYPPALAVAALLAAPKGAGPRARALALLALGGAAGFLLIYGPWGWFVWRRFGNPFGPFFNDIFQSPWFPSRNLRDLNFLPETLTEALFYPYFWAHRAAWVVIEPPMADPRFAVGLSALVLAAGLAAWSRRRGSSPELRSHATGHGGNRIGASVAAAIVMAFILVAYVAWLGAFSILRYALGIEVMLGIPLWAAARAMLAAPGNDAMVRDENTAPAWRRGAALCVGTALGISAIVTEYPQHPREPFISEREPRGAAAMAVTPVTLPESALVVLVGINVSFVAPFLTGPGVRFLGATGWTASGLARGWTAEQGLATHRLTTETLERMRAHSGPKFVLLETPDHATEGPRLDRDVVRAFGISLDRASCQPVPNNVTTLVQICRWR